MWCVRQAQALISIGFNIFKRKNCVALLLIKSACFLKIFQSRTSGEVSSRWRHYLSLEAKIGCTESISLAWKSSLSIGNDVEAGRSKFLICHRSYARVMRRNYFRSLSMFFFCWRCYGVKGLKIGMRKQEKKSLIWKIFSGAWKSFYAYWMRARLRELLCGNIFPHMKSDVIVRWHNESRHNVVIRLKYNIQFALRCWKMWT